jgi:hypothetical protein
MLTLLQPLQLDRKDGDASLILWLCHSFDMEYSFRAALSEVARVVGGKESVSYTLPPEQPAEDFVEGGAVWRGRTYSIYFERMLGYMQFSSPVFDHVQELYDSLLMHCVVESRQDA